MLRVAERSRSGRLAPAYAVVIALAVAPAWLVVGIPGIALFGGTAAISCALLKRPAWSPLAVIAGGALLSVGTLAFGLLVMGSLGAGRLLAVQAWVVLALPFVVAMLVVLVSRLTVTTTTSGAQPPVRDADELAADRSYLLPVVVSMVGVVVVAGWLRTTAAGGGLAWAMSGDARNHVLFVREVVLEGGLTLETLRGYPALYNALVGVHAAAGGRPALSGALLRHDVDSLAAVYVWTVALTVGVLACAAAQLVRIPGAQLSTEGPSRWLLPVAAGALIGSPVALGTALTDGFFTGVAGLLLLVATIVVSAQSLDRSSGELALLAGAGALLLLVTWPVLALMAAPLTGVAGVRALQASALRADRVLGGASVALAFAPLLVFWTARAEFARVLVLPGVITIPRLSLLLVLLGVLIGASAMLRRLLAGPALLIAGVALTAGAVVVLGLALLPEGPQAWTYYSAKTLWLLESGMLYLLLLPGAYIALRTTASGVRERLVTGAGAGAALLAGVGVATMGTTLPQPLVLAARGWSNPAAPIAQQVFTEGDQGRPYVFWKWSDATSYGGNDRLANFWAAAAWPTAPASGEVGVPALPDVAKDWAYRVGGVPAELCELALAVPGLVVHTRDPALPATLGSSCPTAAAEIRVVG